MGGRPAAPTRSRTQRRGVVGADETTILVHGRPISYVTAPHACPVHGRTRIAEGSPTVLVYGKPMARATDQASCGCKIVGDFAPQVLIGDFVERLKEWLGLAAPVETDYGQGIRIVGSREFIRRAISELDQLKTTPTGRQILERIDDPALRKQGRVTIMEETEDCNFAMTTPVKIAGFKSLADLHRAVDAMPIAQWEPVFSQVIARQVAPTPGNPDRLVVTEPGSGAPADQIVVGDSRCYFRCEVGTFIGPVQPKSLSLGHELVHTIHSMEGTSLRLHQDPRDLGSNLEEARTMGTGLYEGDPMTENQLRKEMGVKPRAGHGTHCPVGWTDHLIQH